MRSPRRRGRVEAMEPTVRRLPVPPGATQPDRNAPRTARQRLLHLAPIALSLARPRRSGVGRTGNTEGKERAMRRTVCPLNAGWHACLALLACLSVVASVAL